MYEENSIIGNISLTVVKTKQYQTKFTKRWFDYQIICRFTFHQSSAGPQHIAEAVRLTAYPTEHLFSTPLFGNLLRARLILLKKPMDGDSGLKQWSFLIKKKQLTIYFYNELAWFTHKTKWQKLQIKKLILPSSSYLNELQRGK